MEKKADSYAEQLNVVKGTPQGQEALGKMSPGEIGWGVAGAVGGGALGYLMSRLLHRRPSGRTKLLYTMLGALAGGGGSQLLLSKMKGSEGFDGSKKDEMRLSGLSVLPTVNVDQREPGMPKQPKGWQPWQTAATAGTVGAIRGLMLGEERGSLLTLNPNTYEALQAMKGNTRASAERHLRRVATNKDMKPHGKYAEGTPYGRWIIEGTKPENLTLKGSFHPTREAVNGASSALLHAGVAYGADKLIRALAGKHGFSDPNRAYVTPQDIIRVADAMRNQS